MGKRTDQSPPRIPTHDISSEPPSTCAHPHWFKGKFPTEEPERGGLVPREARGRTVGAEPMGNCWGGRCGVATRADLQGQQPAAKKLERRAGRRSSSVWRPVSRCAHHGPTWIGRRITGLLTKSDVQDTLDDRLPRAEGSSSSTGPVDGGRGQADDTRVPEAEVCPARVLEVSPRRPGREHSALSSDARPRRLPPTITLFFFLRMSFPLRRVRHLRRFLLPPSHPVFFFPPL